METIAEFRFVYKEANWRYFSKEAAQMQLPGGAHVLIFALLCVDREVSFV